MKNLFLFCLLLSGMLLSGADEKLSALSEKYLLGAWNGNAVAYIPLAGKVPAIDGNQGENEWSDAVKLSGFMSKTLLVPERSGYVALMRDAKYLYVLVRTTTPDNDPGGGLAAKVTDRDGNVYEDDSIELMFAPRHKPDFARHLIFNVNKALYDRKVDLRTGASDILWNLSGYEAESKAESGWWTFEAKLPLSELGAGDNGLLFNVARNWSGFGPSAINDTNVHIDTQKMIAGIFSDRAPFVRMDEPGSPETGHWDISAEAVNPSSKKMMLAVMLRNYSWPKVDGKIQRKMEIDFQKEVLVEPGKSVRIELKKEVDSRGRWLSVVLYDPIEKNVLFSRLVCGKKEISAGRLPITGTFVIPKFGSGYYRHYPGYEKAVFTVIPDSSSVGKELVLMLDGQPLKGIFSGRQMIFETALAGNSGKITCSLKKNGDLLLDKVPLCTIVPKEWPWLNNSLGKDRVIIPPFTAIRKNGENGLSTLRCQYRFSTNGLLESILADGHEILEAPAYSEMEIDGKTIVFKGGKTVTRIADDGIDAMTGTVSRADGVTVKTFIRSEYDNYNVHSCELSGIEGRKITRWTLYFPLKESEATLFHAVSNTIRTNPSGDIPSGTGTVWDGTKLIRASVFGIETIHPQFVPYLWMGGTERGLAWFANNSLGMKLDRKKSAVRIVRSPRKVTLEVDLINRPVSLRNGHRVEFGTQATPVKPVDRNVRGMTYDAYGEGIPEMPNAEMISGHILGFPFNWAKTPCQEDYSLFEKFTDACLNYKKIDFKEVLESYLKIHGAEIRSLYLSVDPDTKKVDQYEKSRYIWIGINFGPLRKKASLPYKYSDPRLVYTPLAVTKYFQCEWFNPSPQGYFGAMRTTPTPSNVDYLVYAYDLEFKHGMKGCYLDDMFLMPEINPDTMAKIDEEGELHSDTGLYALRELVKRIAVLQYRYGQSPRMLQVHMTNAQLIPVFSFATSQLGWESDFGEKPLQERYRRDMILAENTGLQAGNSPLALGGILRRTTPKEKWNAELDSLSRTLLALSMPHDIGIWLRATPLDVSRKTVLAASNLLGKFGIHANDCVFEPYFDPGKAPREITGDGLMISAYARPNRKLIVIGNTDGRTRTFSVKGEFSALIDAETGKTLAPDDRTVKPYDFRLLEFVRPQMH